MLTKNHNIWIQLLIWTWFALTTSCTAQSKQTSEKSGLSNNNEMNEIFDIAAYNENIKDPSYEGYELNDDTFVQQFGDEESGFIEKFVPKEGYFLLFKEYYPDGKLKLKGKIYKYGSFQKGEWLEYDSTGKETGKSNFDDPFTFGFKDVESYCSSEEIDLKDSGTTLNRKIVDGNPVWFLSYNTGKLELDAYVIENLEISGKDGTVKELAKSSWMDN